MTVENEWLRLTRKGDDKEMTAVMTMIRTGDHLGVKKYLRDGGDANARNHMGYTLLHVACMEGKSQVVEVLLDGGASVNSCTVDQTTPLHRAASHGHKNVAELLLDKKAYINAQDKKGDTPLHLAAQCLKTDVTKLLLARNADKSRLNLKKQIFTDVIGQQMIPVIEGGDTETLLPWIDWGVSPNVRGAMNWSILHHAAARGQLNCASLILEKKGDVNILDSNNATPLHTASFHGNLKMAKLLIASGANINAQDQAGKTPLFSAVSGSQHESINLLLEKGGDPDIPDNEGNSFTHLVNEFLVRAVHNVHVNQVHGVLRAKADPDSKDSSGVPVLCYAAFKGSLMIADALLEYGADANIKDDEYGKTPLHWAAFWGQFFILRSLLEKGASPKIKDKHGRTPLHEASQEGHEDILTVLCARFAPINEKDNDGNTPLHLAAKWGKCAQVEQLLEQGAMELQNNNGLLYSDLSLIRAVRTGDKAAVISGLAWGGNSNTKDEKGVTLLHHAILKDMDDIVELLMKNSADVSMRDKHGRNALLLAAYRGNHQVMECLIRAGIDINAQDWNGSTPLHWAANEGTIDTVHYLLQHGADTTIKNNKGELYTDLLLKHLYFAVRRNELDTVVRMLKAGADQNAIVFGTELTPKEEACRREHWPILQHMVKVGPPKEPKPEDPNTMLALQDVYRLFKEPSSSDEDSGEEDTEDAYWKMSNAERVHSYAEVFKDDEGEDLWSAWQEKPISAKDLFKEETAAFWKDLEEDLKQRLEEEKANAISATEFFKEDKPWWEKNEDDDDDDEDENEDGSEEADDEDDESDEEYHRKLLKENSIPAKDIFKEEHPYFKEEIISKEEVMSNDTPWWENNVETKEKETIISKDEIMKTNICWWENNNESTDEKHWPNNKENNKDHSEVITKEQAMNQDVAWWKNNDKNEEELDQQKEEVNGMTIPKDEIMKAEAPWWIQKKDVEVITKEEFNKEENQNWWETNVEPEKAEQKPWWENKKENVISAKELFKDEHPWFTNPDENVIKENEKVISLQEVLKDENSSWWDARHSPPKDESLTGTLKKSSLDASSNNITEDNEENKIISNHKGIVSTKEFFDTDERPWWYNGKDETSEKLNQCYGTENETIKSKEEKSEENEDQSSEDTSEEETSSETEDDQSSNDDKSEQDDEDKSVDDDIEESRTDTWEDANDSVFSETSTMYSISDGNQKISQPWWEEKKPWWEESTQSSDTTDSTPIQDIGICKGARDTKSNIATSGDTKTEINTITHTLEQENTENHTLKHNTEINQPHVNEIQSAINGNEEQELDIHSEDEIDDICDEEVEEHESDSGCISTTFEPIKLINEEANEELVEKLNAKIDIGTVKDKIDILTELTPKNNTQLQTNNNEVVSKHEPNNVTDARRTETLQDLSGKVVTEMVSKHDPILQKNDNIDVDVTNSDPSLLLSLDPSKLLEMGLQKSDSQTSGYESSLSLSTTDTNKPSNKNSNNIIVDNNIINANAIKTPLTQEISSSKNGNLKSHPTLLVTQYPPEIKTQGDTTKHHVHLHDPQPLAAHLSPQTDIDDVKAFDADYKHEVSDAAKLAEKLVEQMESIINSNPDKNKNIPFIDINAPNDQTITSAYTESFKKNSLGGLNKPDNTGEKIVNKMDDCLAKVDSSLAWIDAKITKENNVSKSIRTPIDFMHVELDNFSVSPETKTIQNIKNNESTKDKTKFLDPVTIPKESHISDTPSEVLTPKSDDEEFVFHEEIPVKTFQSPRLPRKAECLVIHTNNLQGNLKSSKGIVNELSNQELKVPNISDINSESLSPKSDNEEFIFHDVVPVRTFQSPRLPRKEEISVKKSIASEISVSNSKLSEELLPNTPINVVKLPPLTAYQETKNMSESSENIQTTSTDMRKENKQYFQEIKGNEELPDDLDHLRTKTEISNKDKVNNVSKEDPKTYELKEPSICENNSNTNDFKQSNNNQYAEKLHSETIKSTDELLDSIDEIIPEDKSSKTVSTESLNSYPIISLQELVIPDKTLWRCSTYDTMSLSDYDNIIYSLGTSTSLTVSDSEESLKGSRLSLTSSTNEGSPKQQHIEELFVKKNSNMDDTISQACSDAPQSQTSKVCPDSVDNLCTDPVVEAVGSGSQEIKEPSNKYETFILKDNLPKSDSETTYKKSDSISISSEKEKESLINKNKDKNNLDKETIKDKVPKHESNSCDEALPSSAHPSSSSHSTADLDKPSSLVVDQKKISKSSPTNKQSTSKNCSPPVVPQRTRGNKDKSQTLDRQVADQYTVNPNNAQRQNTNTPLLYNPDKSEDGAKVGQLPPRSGEPQSSQGTSRNEKQEKQNNKELKAAAGKNDSVRKSTSCRVS